MSILPRGSQIVLTIADTPLTLFVDELKDSYTTQAFERPEFSYHRLLQAPNQVDGSMPVIVYGFGNVPTQITSTCSSIAPRVLTADDPVIPEILQRKNIHQYEIPLIENLAATVDAIPATARQHSLFLARFEADMKKRSEYVSYEQLLAWQAENFSYLTSTNVSISGVQIPSESNCLIVNFQRGVAVEVPGSVQNVILKGGSITLQIITIESAIN